jgi:hypothetical protein
VLSFPTSLLTSAAFAQLPVVEPPRGWKTSAGQPFQATVAKLRRDGRRFSEWPTGAKAQAPAALLSAEDQQYLAEWQKKQPIKNTHAADRGVWDPATMKTEVVSEDAGGGKIRVSHAAFLSSSRRGNSRSRCYAKWRGISRQPTNY